MRRFVIGTAGHVDHGKTALVRALTGVETDRLAEEKRRGISIELGFAPWRLAGDVEATIVDVPGHRRLVRAMIAGASGIELVLLVVAANEGVMPQTREHAHVCAELGIRRAVLVLTKSDLVDPETLALAELEGRELLARDFEVTVATCSATRGEGLEALRDAVAARLRALPPRRAEGPARLWVDRVFSVRGAGTVVTGTLSSGAIARGDALSLLGPSGVRGVVARELRVHAETLERAGSPTRLAVNLPIPAAHARRGDLLTSDPAIAPTSRVDVEIRGERLPRGASVTLHFGTAMAPAKVTRVDPADAGDAPAYTARLVLDAPRPLAGGDRLIVRGRREETRGACGATILDARPHARSQGTRRRELLGAVRGRDAAAVLSHLLDEAAPRPLPLAALRGRLALDPEALAGAARAASKRGDVVPVGEGVVARATLAALADRARALVVEHAERAPLDRGLSLATLLQRLAERAGPEAAEAALRAARAPRGKDDPGRIVIDGDVAALEVRRVDPALADALARAAAELATAGAHGVGEHAIATAVGPPRDRARAILAALERQGAAVRAGELWFSAALVRALRGVVEAHLAGAPSLSVIEFKALGSLPRKQAILLLEHFDRIGVTRRVGEARVLSKAG